MSTRRLTGHESEHVMSTLRDVREAVEEELSFDPLVDAADITVRNISGVVALNGTVPSYPQYLQAAAAARRVNGVTSVHNHLEVLLPLGRYRDDAMLTTVANNALTFDISVPDGVEATAQNGNIRLTGTVTFGSERAAAESAVAGLIGVRNIKDEIGIIGEPDPIDVTARVQGALDRSSLVPDDSDVAVYADGSTVTLSGHVRTWAEHDAVIGAAWMAGGVYDVRDELLITGRRPSAKDRSQGPESGATGRAAARTPTGDVRENRASSCLRPGDQQKSG